MPSAFRACSCHNFTVRACQQFCLWRATPLVGHLLRHLKGSAQCSRTLLPELGHDRSKLGSACVVLNSTLFTPHNAAGATMCECPCNEKHLTVARAVVLARLTICRSCMNTWFEWYVYQVAASCCLLGVVCSQHQTGKAAQLSLTACVCSFHPTT